MCHLPLDAFKWNLDGDVPACSAFKCGLCGIDASLRYHMTATAFAVQKKKRASHSNFMRSSSGIDGDTLGCDFCNTDRMVFLYHLFIGS